MVYIILLCGTILTRHFPFMFLQYKKFQFPVVLIVLVPLKSETGDLSKGLSLKRPWWRAVLPLSKRWFPAWREIRVKVAKETMMSHFSVQTCFIIRSICISPVILHPVVIHLCCHLPLVFNSMSLNEILATSPKRSSNKLHSFADRS